MLRQHTKVYAWEPHLHAPGMRSCVEAIWGPIVHTLNCVGYDHNWVKQYLYAPGHEPLLPKGTVVRYIGYLDTTDDNHNMFATERRPLPCQFLLSAMLWLSSVVSR